MYARVHPAVLSTVAAASIAAVVVNTAVMKAQASVAEVKIDGVGKPDKPGSYPQS